MRPVSVSQSMRFFGFSLLSNIMRKSKYAAIFGAPSSAPILLGNPHNGLESANFSIGTGKLLPYQIVRMDSMTGDSKKTMGWEPTLDTAQEFARNLPKEPIRSARGGADYQRNRTYTYYIHDVRNGTIYRV